MSKEVDEMKGHGKKPNQKLKPYLVMHYLTNTTNEEHVKDANAIVGRLMERYGIYAERRSIYRDINEINLVRYMIENDCTVSEAEEAIAADESAKAVVYDKGKRGFYVQKRPFNFKKIRALAECIHSARFLTQAQSDKLIHSLREYTNIHDYKKIKSDVVLLDRIATNNDEMLKSISAINRAMYISVNHAPEKIRFKYLKYTINGLKQVERRKGSDYTVSPYKLIINDGNYYLLAFDDKSKDIRTYRVDRMKNVTLTGEVRDGGEEIAAIDIDTYARRTFSMFDGEAEHVTIRFINPLLDTAVDKFGRDAVYGKDDESHFTVTAKVNVSEQFFAWVCGFGKRAKLISPDNVVERFKSYIENISGLYK